jgi:hypothetical protein
MRRLAVTFLLVACHREPPPSVHREPAAAIASSAPVASASASVAIADPTPPPAPAGCRRTIAAGTDIKHVSDAALRGLIVAGTLGSEAVDCLGHSVKYSAPMKPQRVDRFIADATHMAVFVEVASELGYTSHCPGFAAIVRVDHDEIVTEGVGPEEFDDCDGLTTLQTAMLDGHRALLFPHVASTGESGDFETTWSVSLADHHGALAPVGEITSRRSMGNGSMTTGKWFDALDATLLGTGSLQVEEHWELVREDPDAGEVYGRKRTVVRTYGLDAGVLVSQ